MKNIIRKILKESEEEFDWIDRIEKPISVKVINTGVYYPTYTEAMVYLGISGAKEFIEKYGNSWSSSPENNYGYSKNFLIDNGVNLTEPIKNKIYYTTTYLTYKNGDDLIYKLIDPVTNKEFIIGEKGFVVVDN